MSDENDDEIMGKVKIFSSDDEKLKLLGELLSNKSSRDIIKLLINNEMYTNEIADKLELRVNLVIHHLKKLQDLELLQIRNKTITKKRIEHKHYKINPYFFLAPSCTEEEIHSKGTLKKIFKAGIKVFSVPISIGFSWVIFSPQDGGPGAPNIDNTIDVDPLLVSLVIVIIALAAELIYLKKRKR